MIAVPVMGEMDLARKLLMPLLLISMVMRAPGIGQRWKAADFMTLMNLNLPYAVRVLRMQVNEWT